jgi:hypothetical protein
LGQNYYDGCFFVTYAGHSADHLCRWVFNPAHFTLLIGIGNGCTEAACNPMIADTYSGVKMNKMLNRFHMWFPGGLLSDF